MNWFDELLELQNRKILLVVALTRPGDKTNRSLERVDNDPEMKALSALIALHWESATDEDLEEASRCGALEPGAIGADFWKLENLRRTREKYGRKAKTLRERKD